MMPMGKYLRRSDDSRMSPSHLPSPKHPSTLQLRSVVRQELYDKNWVCIRRPNFQLNGLSTYRTIRGVCHRGRHIRSSLIWHEGPALGRAAPWSEHWVALEWRSDVHEELLVNNRFCIRHSKFWHNGLWTYRTIWGDWQWGPIHKGLYDMTRGPSTWASCILITM